MMETIRNFFAPPVFEGDEEKTRLARTMNGILWVFMGSWGIGLLAVPFSNADNRLSSLLTILGLSMLGVIGLIALRRGYIRGIAHFFAFSLWASSTVIVALMGGIESPETGSYVLPVIFAGLFMGLNWIYIYTALGLLSLASIHFLDINNLLPPVALPINNISDS